MFYGLIKYSVQRNFLTVKMNGNETKLNQKPAKTNRKICQLVLLSMSENFRISQISFAYRTFLQRSPSAVSGRRLRRSGPFRPAMPSASGHRQRQLHRRTSESNVGGKVLFSNGQILAVTQDVLGAVALRL